MMRRRPLVLVAWFGLSATSVASLACKKDKAPDPGGTTTIKPEPSSSGSTASTKPKSGPNGPLQIVATRDGPLVLTTLGDGTVLVGSGISAALVRGDGELERDAAWTNGLFVNGMGYGAGMAIDDVDFGGRFPEDAWISESSSFGRGGTDVNVAHWESGAWKKVPNQEGKLLWYYAAFGPWKDGRTIALRLYSIPDQGPDEGAWEPLQALLAKTKPRFEVPGQKVDGLPAFADGASPITFASLSSGDALAIVTVGKDATAKTQVQRWTAGGDAKGVLESLPDLSVELGSPVVSFVSASSAWIGGSVDDKPYLAHFDGKTWTKKDTTMKGAVTSIAEAPDGTVWAVTAPESLESGKSALGGLWKKAADVQSFEPIALPKTKFPGDADSKLGLDLNAGTSAWSMVEGDPKAAKTEWFLAPRQVVVSKSGEPFVVAFATDDETNVAQSAYQFPGVRSVLLRPRSVPKPIELPSRTDVWLEIEDRNTKTLATAVSDDCATFFVDAGLVPDGSPADYDPKELREAMKSIPDPGLTETSALEVRLQGKRHVGLHVTTCRDECQKNLDKLVTALAKKLPAKPILSCRVPTAIRDLKLEFGK